MFSSASSTERPRERRRKECGGRTGRFERGLARLLVIVLIGTSPSTALAGEEFASADEAVMLTPGTIDNSVANETTIDSLADQGLTHWAGGLEQATGHTLYINQPSIDSSTHTNTVGGNFTAHLDGSLISNGNVVIASPFGVFIGSDAIIDVGGLVAIGGEISRDAFMAAQGMEIPLTGAIENRGVIRADDHVSLFGDRISNFGEIEIADGSLLMVAADSVWVTEFDNPVSFEIPHAAGIVDQTQDPTREDAQYAIENHGRIEAGLGHVRLAASDPLGFAIRQGSGSDGVPASIRARRIELEGGETGRVHLAGVLDASDESGAGRGGAIDVTGSLIVLENADVLASGSLGGGTIQIGGEQEGRGDLQRARAVIVDEDSEIRADALERGNGGRIILFAEDLTSVEGALSARGGQTGGDGGFVETSGLRNFSITRTPDLSAPSGDAGSWLIDPFNITISATPQPCPTDGIACLDKAIDAILSPDFDPAGFDGILRTVDPDINGANANFVFAGLIADALATGTDVTLSTQAFGVDTGTDDGDIDVDAEILVTNADTLEGTTATLTLLAARNINLDNRIASIESVAVPDGRANLALSVELRANDAGQFESDRDFDTDLLEGDLSINAEIRTGGGDVTLSGSSVVQQAGLTIDTNGGSVEIRSGTVDQNGNPSIVRRRSADPVVDPVTPDPRIEIAGSVDTSDGVEPGGDVSMVANSLNVSTRKAGDDPLTVVTGQLILMSGSQISTGGGDVTLSGGNPPSGFGSNFAGSVALAGDIDSAGGDVSIDSTHVDPDGDTGAFAVSFLDPMRAEGGVIDIDADITTAGGALSIGSDRTQRIELDGNFDTRADLSQLDTTENGLVQLLALDSPSVDSANDLYGFGEIVVGANASTTISTSSLSIESRNVVFSDGAGANPVTLTASGSSTATLPELTTPDETAEPIGSAEVRITGNRSLAFNQNTQVTGETIRITAAPNPLELNVPEPPGTSERPNSETRLTFGGTNGAGQVAADGVRLNGDVVSISVGDGTTPGAGLFSDVVGTSLDPTDFDVLRLTRGAYDGLQLRSSDDAMLRPEEFVIRQDGDFTVTAAAPTADGELDLAGAFDTATIGASGMRSTLESSDGVLKIEDAAALNNGAGMSFVVLNGGLFLPDSPNEPIPAVDDTVVFGDTQALGLGGTTAFDVESLTVSTPGNFTIDQRVTDSIMAATELVFEAGRVTGTAGTAGRGTLTVEDATTLGTTIQQPTNRIALLAGASGFGDLVFVGTSPTLTTLAANEIELRAGGGVASENTDTAARSRITGLQANVAIQDENGAVFGDMASSATAFRYRQDAAIDAETDLPTLAQFGLVPATGFRATGDIEYEVRSDQASIDLDDGIVGTNEGDRFRNAALSLFGAETTSTPAIDVSDEFTFVGKRVELGGIGDFTFTQGLASAFNRSGLDAEEEITLRAGIAVAGELSFNRGALSSVLVKAPRVNLVAGNGFNLTTEVQFESTIDVRNAEFDLSGPVGADPTFLFHTDALFEVGDLPDIAQFTGGSAGLPDILAIRTDLAALELDDFDVSLLPLDLTNDPGRLVLEAESITLSQTDGDDLELSSIANLDLRLRTNNLAFIAADPTAEAADVPPPSARVLIGARPGDMQPVVGMDSDFDGESLLIEAFDRDATIATVENLSSLAADPNVPGQFDLAQGRGPTVVNVRQDGAVTPDGIFQRNAVSGLFARSSFDDEVGDPIPVTYTITSVFNPVSIEPENVNSSSLVLGGFADTADLDGIIFEPGSGADPGFFDLDSLLATTEVSILIQDGTRISTANALAFAAGILPVDVDDPGTVFGRLVFEDGPGLTRLSGQTVNLTAGPAFELDGPDVDADGEPVPVDDALLPRIDFRGLDEIVLNGSAEDSAVDIRQSATLDPTDPIDGPKADYLTPLAAGMGASKWASLVIDVVQGNLNLTDLDVLKDLVSSLTGQNSGIDGTLMVNVPDQAMSATPFDDFDDTVEFVSNDMTFVTTDPATSINLATEKLVLVSRNAGNGSETDEELARLRSDPDSLDRPIVRIHQAIDFASSELPRPDQYQVIDAFGRRSVRSDLGDLDIELRTTGTLLTLDDAIRSRVTTANLILDSGGDVDIMLDGPTPGFAGLDYAALQLTSLEIVTPDTTGPMSMPDGIGDGAITIRPFMIGGSPEPLTIQTTGDQRFDGTLVLDTTLSTRGRDILFSGDVTQAIAPDAGLRVSTSGNVVFESDIGSSGNPLDHLWLAFDSKVTTGTPNVEFGRRTDMDGDGISETPEPSDQSVWVLQDILFAAYDFASDLTASDIETGLATIGSLPTLQAFLSNLDLGRERAAGFATVGKALGDLVFNVSNGDFIMASGEKLSVGGTATINTDAGSGLVALGDVSALDLDVVASGIGLVRRASGVVLARSGETEQDAGPSISANTIDFGMVMPTTIGSGRSFRFGLPNPFETATIPIEIRSFPLFELKPSGQPFAGGDFRFLSTTSDLADRVPSLRPTGASRSDLSGAFGPEVEPTPVRPIPEPFELRDADKLLELAVDAHETPNAVKLARLEGAALIDDLTLPRDEESAAVTSARLDADDADAAIALYEELFGPDGERSDEIREVLQDALDRYLANTRARRVVGFELRRFVKNRPSTLLEAYQTLESLDTLFRYHRRLGLSPGEYRRIQNSWLRRIQPDGITLDELAEAIHPSRYVRGSDILDIFGQ